MVLPGEKHYSCVHYRKMRRNQKLVFSQRFSIKSIRVRNCGDEFSILQLYYITFLIIISRGGNICIGLWTAVKFYEMKMLLPCFSIRLDMSVFMNYMWLEANRMFNNLSESLALMCQNIIIFFLIKHQCMKVKVRHIIIALVSCI